MTVRTTRLGPGKRSKGSPRRDSGLQGMQTKPGKVRTDQSRSTIHKVPAPRIGIERVPMPKMPMMEQKKRAPKRKNAKT